ncbi:type II toxin-antitoxin system prevent-host-death family antitoxin [Sphingobium aquiterrae]|uniref:type II toxin-antitoxin system prevent-host-death family antitoxin n=1 Tax=Sphingobium aquiterrae TaxID=2038656 RepID=UPI003018F3F2
MNAETLRSTTKKKVPRTAFHNHTGQYPDISRREPITVTKHGRPDITIVEAAYFERLAAGQILAVLDLNAADADQMPDAHRDLFEAAKPSAEEIGQDVWNDDAAP